MHGTRYQREYPGRVSGNVLGIQDEIFALGRLIYEIWTTRQPYRDEDEKTVVQRYRNNECPDMTGLPTARIITGMINPSMVAIAGFANCTVHSQIQ